MPFCGLWLWIISLLGVLHYCSPSSWSRTFKASQRSTSAKKEQMQLWSMGSTCFFSWQALLCCGVIFGLLLTRASAGCKQMQDLGILDQIAILVVNSSLIFSLELVCLLLVRRMGIVELHTDTTCCSFMSKSLHNQHVPTHPLAPLRPPRLSIRPHSPLRNVQDTYQHHNLQCLSECSFRTSIRLNPPPPIR